MNNREKFRAQAEELVGKMTVEEAASQLLHHAPAIERLEYRSTTGGTRRCMGSAGPELQRFFLRRSEWRRRLTLIF